MAQLLQARELEDRTFRPALADAPPALAHRIAAARGGASANLDLWLEPSNAFDLIGFRFEIR